MRAMIRDLDIRRRTQVALADIARQLNPLLRGWIDYYGRYMASALHSMLRYVNQTLLAWAMRSVYYRPGPMLSGRDPTGRSTHFTRRL
jgi:RNA-directed DNA polymerase